MDTNHKSIGKQLPRWTLKRWAVCAAMLLAFVVGCLVSADFIRLRQVRADNNRVFELMIYHTLPGQASTLESIFRDDSKLMAKHGLDVIGFWVPNEDPAWTDTFLYVVAFPNREEAKRRWRELHDDPATRPYVEAAKPIIQRTGDDYRVDEVFMRPTDFSALK